MLKLFALMWVVAVMGPNGIETKQIKDPATFPTEIECKNYAEAHTERMGDWIRGLLQVSWDFPVAVAYKCIADGEKS